MPGLYLLQLFNTKENCHIQSNLFKNAHISGAVVINDSKSGENFCGNAGDTTGHSGYTNETSSSSKSASSAHSSSSAHSAANGNVGSHNVSQPGGTANPSHNAGHQGNHGGSSNAGAAAMAKAKQAEKHNGGGHQAPTPAKKAPAPAKKASSSVACGSGWGQSSCLQQIIILL